LHASNYLGPSAAQWSRYGLSRVWIEGAALDGKVTICSYDTVKIAGPKKADRSQPNPGRTARSQPSSPAARDAATPIQLRHLAILLIGGIAVLGLLWLALDSYWSRPQPVFQDAPRLVAALQAFSRDRFLHGNKLPSSVSLKELVDGGYLTPNDVRAFEGIEVTFSNVATNQDPHTAMIHARLPDGSVLAVLADGSVQQLRK
jgi:hypothetical protein